MKKNPLKKNPIKLIEPLSVAVYFFLGAVVVAFISAKLNGVTEPLTKIVAEQVVLSSYLLVGAIVLLISYIHSFFNRLDKPRNSYMLNTFIVTPGNFIVTLGFVAIAIAWGEFVVMKWLVELTRTAKNVYLPKVQESAIHITILVPCFWVLLRTLYINESELNAPSHKTYAKGMYYITMTLMTILSAFFFGTLLARTYKLLV